MSATWSDRNKAYIFHLNNSGHNNFMPQEILGDSIALKTQGMKTGMFKTRSAEFDGSLLFYYFQVAVIEICCILMNVISSKIDFI